MERYEYAYVRLNDGLYDGRVQVLMAEIFDLAANDAGLDGETFSTAFINSGLAYHIERQNPKYVLGQSAADLITWMCEQVGLDCDLPQYTNGHGGPDRWLGEMLAYFQIHTGCPYRRIFEAYPYDMLRDSYWSHENWSYEDYAEYLRKIITERQPKSRLSVQRKAAGLTQAELADAAQLTVRAIQQYEQGVKSINKAAAESVYKLSLVLGCTVEDLLESPL